MRKLMFLVLTISGLAIGCGSSDSDNTDTTGSPSTEADAGGGNGGGNGTGGATGANTGTNGSANGGGSIAIDGDASAGGEEPDMYPDCDKPAAVMTLGPAGTRWTGDAPWTMQQFMDCQAKCTDGSLECFRTMCDAGQAFYDCFTGEAGACAAEDEDAVCYGQWEDLGCCAAANNCTTSQEAFDMCTSAGGACASVVSSFSTCASMKCQSPAATRCVKTGAAGGGAMPAPAPAMIPAEFVTKIVGRLN